MVPTLIAVAVPQTSLIGFTILCLAAAASFVFAVRSAAPAGSATKWTIAAAVGMGGWMLATALLGQSGFLEGGWIPPRLLIVLIAMNIAIIAFTRSRAGVAVARSVPWHLLVGVQAFRIVVELFLHAWYKAGVIPVQMTYSGMNFDIATGILAIPAGIYLWRTRDQGTTARRKAVFLGFNVVGFALLAVIVVIAMLSTPTSFRTFMNEPTNDLLFAAPTIWLATVCVGVAALGHVMSFRSLRFAARSAAPEAAVQGVPSLA